MKPFRMMIFLLACVALAGCETSERLEQRDKAAPMRTLAPRYNSAFFYRHNNVYRQGAAIHYAHGKAHDDLQLTPLNRAYFYDELFDNDYVSKSYNPPSIEPSMMYWGPYTGQAAWQLYRAIDWTHHHHEMTYDVLSESDIPWSRKQEWTDKTVEVYLDRDMEVARSPAVLDLTMRRAGVLMKPYFGAFRNNYPQATTYFFVAHWWHPVIYEAMMIAGNDNEQDVAVERTHNLLFTRVFHRRPQRMLLSRENMPRYSRMSPESANIFDNLHMLHGIAYDILAYEGWTMEQKRQELYRVVHAMARQPGDENYVRRFRIPHPEMDPRVYYDWMQTYDGEMNAMMEEMFVEMWPMMSPEGVGMPSEEIMRQVRMKFTPGMQAGEIPGSLHDALMELVPGMQMDQESMKPGVTPVKMVNAMLESWYHKAEDIPDVQPIAMDEDPVLPPDPEPRQRMVQRNMQSER